MFRQFESEEDILDSKIREKLSEIIHVQDNGDRTHWQNVVSFPENNKKEYEPLIEIALLAVKYISKFYNVSVDDLLGGLSIQFTDEEFKDYFTDPTVPRGCFSEFHNDDGSNALMDIRIPSRMTNDIKKDSRSLFLVAFAVTFCHELTHVLQYKKGELPKEIGILQESLLGAINFEISDKELEKIIIEVLSLVKFRRYYYIPQEIEARERAMEFLRKIDERNTLYKDSDLNDPIIKRMWDVQIVSSSYYDFEISSMDLSTIPSVVLGMIEKVKERMSPLTQRDISEVIAIFEELLMELRYLIRGFEDSDNYKLNKGQNSEKVLFELIKARNTLEAEILVFKTY